MDAQQIPNTLGDYIGIIRRRWIHIVTILPAAILLAVYLAFTLPAVYQSSGTILLEPSSIPEDMVPTTVTTFASQQLELVWRRIFTIDNLTGLVQQIDPYPDSPDLTDREKARQIVDATSTERVDPITLEPLETSTAFSVHYLNPDPEIAEAIAQRLVDMFLDYSRQTRTEQATETVSFLQSQSEEANKKVLELESKIAAFKEEHGSALPEAQQRNLSVLDRAERDLEATQQQILTARERKSTLELQLAQINPYLFDPDGDWRAELDDLRAQLAEARQRYTEDHPDVRRLRRSIQALSERAEVEQSGEPAVPDNPQYIQIQTQLGTATQELAALEQSAATTRKQISEYERRLDVAPEVEREYTQLQRDYDLARDRLRGIENDLSEANMARVLESEQRGLRYSLIRSPGVPSTPISPNRLGIILLGIVLGGGLAFGVAAVREGSDPTIRSARDLSQITDVRPLGAIPVILNQADKRRRLAVWTASLIVFAGAVSFVASVVVA